MISGQWTVLIHAIKIYRLGQMQLGNVVIKCAMVVERMDFYVSI